MVLLKRFELLTILKKHKEIVALILFFSFLYSYISIQKHLHYQTFTWDAGFFDQLLWKLSRFHDPVSSFTNLYIFGDHFQFIMLIFVPLYWLPNSIYLVFIFHAMVATLAALPIYFLSLLKNKSKLIALSVSFSFLIFVPLQFSILDLFHQSAFSPLFYSSTLFALVSKKTKLYWISIIGLLIIKEEMALLAMSIGILAFFYGERLKGIITIICSLFVFFFAVYIFLPRVQGNYVHFNYGQLGYTPVDVVKNAALQPLLFMKLLFSSSVKIKTIFETFFSFGFLPLFSPSMIIPAVEQFLVRFLDTVTIHRWTNLNHYAFPLSAIMACASVFAINKIQLIYKRVPRSILNLLIASYLIFFALTQAYILHGPVNSLLKRDFYDKKDWMKNNDTIISYVPRNASIAATNNFGPHISQRDYFYLIGQNNFAQFLLFDLNDGPNKYSPLNFISTQEVFQKELDSGNYKIYKKINDAVLLKSVSVNN